MLKLIMGVERNSWTALWIAIGAIGLFSILGFVVSGGTSSDPSTPTNYTDTDEPGSGSGDPDRLGQVEEPDFTTQ